MNDIPTPKVATMLERIKRTFPDLTWQKYQYLDEGWDHDVIILDNIAVFRFPNDEEYAHLLKDEIEVLKQLAPVVAIRIPNYTYVAPDVSFAGYPIIPGKTLLKPYFDTLSAQDKHDIAQQLAGLLSTMHTFLDTKPEARKLIPNAYLVEDQIATKKQVKQYLTTVLDAEDYTRVERILHEVDGVLTQKLPAVFLHGDIYSRHLLWEASTKRLGVIDFSDMNLGDPAIDFSELYEYGEEFVRDVYDSYTGLKDDTFLKRAWIYQQWVGVYMMTDHFINHKNSFTEARETFDRVKVQHVSLV